jgi:hypothetical protein
MRTKSINPPTFNSEPKGLSNVFFDVQLCRCMLHGVYFLVVECSRGCRRSCKLPSGMSR